MWSGGGAVAQLGERLVRNEEVSGSIPLSSTKTTFTKLPEGPTASLAAGFFGVLSSEYGPWLPLTSWGTWGQHRGHPYFVELEMPPKCPLPM
jgi:hypothetical protein